MEKKPLFGKHASEIIQGHSCEFYELSWGRELHVAACVANDLLTPLRLDPRLVPLLLTDPVLFDPALASILDKTKELTGFSLDLLVSKTAHRVVVGRIQVKELKGGPVPDSTFAVPSGYHKKDPVPEGK